MMAAELAILHREHGVMDLILVDMDPSALRSSLALELLARGGGRLAVCRRDRGVLAVCKREASRTGSTYAVSAVLSALSSAGPVNAASWVSLVDDGLPAVPGEVLMNLGRLALDESRAAFSRKVERIVIGGEELAASRPWQGAQRS
jgi:hypothetical protein